MWPLSTGGTGLNWECTFQIPALVVYTEGTGLAAALAAPQEPRETCWLLGAPRQRQTGSMVADTRACVEPSMEAEPPEATEGCF